MISRQSGDHSSILVGMMDSTIIEQKAALAV
jgi:hypothetical protein